MPRYRQRSPEPEQKSERVTSLWRDRRFQATVVEVALDVGGCRYHSAAMQPAPATTTTTLIDRLIADDRWTSSVIRDLLVHARRPDVISLAGGLPADELLPLERCGAAVDRVLVERGALALQYGVSAGEPGLRALLTRPSEPDPDRIIVTAGSQQALDLVARVLVASNGPNMAAIEDPGYLGAVQILRSHRFVLVGIPVDADGLCVEVLADRLANGLSLQLCYVNPTFQNPTGATLSPERAVRLVELAERHDFVIVADDPYVELSLDGVRRSGFPDSDRVIRLGSVSKTVAPGLRIGWLDADPRLSARLVLAKQAADLHTSTFNQFVVTEILSDDGWWAGHLDGLRARYGQRRSALADAIAHRLPDAIVTPQHGGFFWWVQLPMGCDGLLPVALDHGVAFVPGSAFAIDVPAGNSLRLSYSAGDPEHFDEALLRLSRAVTDSTGSCQ